VGVAKVCGVALVLATLSLVALILADGQEVTARGDMGGFLTPDGQLVETLELQDAQEGFAGLSGEILTVQPDGTWRIARFLNDRVEEPHRQGRLSAKELKALAGVLAEQDFNELPAVVGQAPEVNPHRITVRFGETSSTLLMEPGQDVPAIAALQRDQRSEPQTKLVTIVETTRRLIEP
jgi:hypothetical protein